MVSTHKPSGLPAWPIILLAGGEKCGKSYACVEFSKSQMIDRTFYFEIGEMKAEEYGEMQGARHEIVDHDGTYPSMLAEAESILEVPRGKDGKPHCIVVDSIGKLWELLGDEQSSIMKQRKKSTITVDQWNVAKKKWKDFFHVLAKHNGPVILTARYELVALMDERGMPTGGKDWKIKAEKNLGFDVDATITCATPRDWVLTTIASLRYDLPPGGKKLPGFTIERFLGTLGLDQAGPRRYVPTKEDISDEPAGRITFDQLEGASDQGVQGVRPATAST